MSTASTSSVLIHEAVTLCDGVVETLINLQREIRRKYQNAGNEWKDSKYKQLGDIIDECSSLIDDTLSELEHCLVPLGDMEKSIQEYERVNINRTDGAIHANTQVFTADRIAHMVDERVLSSFEERLRYVPKLKSKRGRWEGERGNSRFYPNKPEIIALLTQYNEDSVEYIQAVPDFSPFTRHNTEQWGDFIGEVSIPNMNERTNSSDGYGRRRPSERYNHITYLGNYEQADVELARRLTNENRTVSPADIERFRTDNRLTWHECIDMETMQLIPTDINDCFRHFGGTAEARTLRGYDPTGEYTGDLADVDELVRIRDSEQ